MPHPASFCLLVFSKNKHYNFTRNQCEKVSGVEIQTHDFSEHESSPITTRPELPSLRLRFNAAKICRYDKPV